MVASIKDVAGDGHGNGLGNKFGKFVELIVDGSRDGF